MYPRYRNIFHYRMGEHVPLSRFITTEWSDQPDLPGCVVVVTSESSMPLVHLELQQLGRPNGEAFRWDPTWPSKNGDFGALKLGKWPVVKEKWVPTILGIPSLLFLVLIGCILQIDAKLARLVNASCLHCWWFGLYKSTIYLDMLHLFYSHPTLIKSTSNIQQWNKFDSKKNSALVGGAGFRWLFAAGKSWGSLPHLLEFWSQLGGASIIHVQI